MDATHYHPPRPPRSGSLVQWFFARLVAAALLLAFGYFGWRYIAVDRLDEEIRQRVEAKFRNHYQGLLVSVDSATRVEGQGIEIRGLTIREPEAGQEPPLLRVERIFAACNTSLPEFVTHEPDVVRIVMQRANVHAVRRKNGSWNVRRLLPPPKFSDQSPPLSLEDGKVDIVDETHPEADPPQWRNVHLTITPDTTVAASLELPEAKAKRAVRLAGGMTGDHFREVRLDGAMDADSGRWRVHGEVEGLAFTPAMRDGLPRDLAAELAPIAAVSGNTHLRFDVDNLAPPSAQQIVTPLRFNVTGEISAGRIDDERLPQPLTDVVAKLRADNRSLRIDELKAKLGAATVELSLQLDGYESSSPMQLRVATKNLALDERLACSLPPDVLKLWQQVSPSGLMNGSLHLAYDGQRWIPELDADFEQLAIKYERFPYRLTDGKAALKLRGNLLTVQGNARAGNSPVKLEAEVRDAGPNWSGWMEARSAEPLPIDERLLNALTPAAREVVQSFNAKGYVQLCGRFDRRAGSKSPPHSHLEVELSDCSLNYRSFAYPIDHVTGTLRGTDGIWSFVNLKGSQGTAQIHGDGSFGPDGTRGSLLKLGLRCTEVALDDTLRKSLSPETQRLWNEIRPRGEIDVLGIGITYRPAQRDFQVEVDGQKILRSNPSVAHAIRVEPTWFPYAMDLSSGTVSYRNGTLQLSKLRGTHGKTKLEADGQCRWSNDGRWSLDLERVNADRLLLDHDLLAAFPSDAGSALAKAKFSGALAMTGFVKLNGKAGEGASLNANWDLSFDVEDGRLAGETPVEHMFGGLRVVGGVEQGRWYSRGDAKLDSLFVRGVQVTRVLGPFYVDSKQLLIGSWAERDIKTGPSRRLTAQVFDGLVATDASVSLSDEGKFLLESTLEQADLAKITQEIGSGTSEVSGKTFGVLQMSGTTRGKHTWRGGGNIRLREAYLYRVPVMVAMLKMLSIRSPDSAAFTTSDIDFRVQGDDVILDRIDLTGDAVSLRGRGRLYEQKQVDLMFYTQVGRRDIQALRPLMAEASPNFLLIEVTGTIDRPSVKKTAFPALNETLREMFPEIARGESAASSAKNDKRADARSTSSPGVGSLWRR